MSKNNIWLFKFNPDGSGWESREVIRKGFEKDGYWSQEEKDIVKYDGDIKDGDIFICLNKEDHNIYFMCNIRKPSINNNCDFDYIEPSFFFANGIKCEEVFGVIPEKLYEVFVPPGKKRNTYVSLFNLSDYGDSITKLINKIVEKNKENIANLTETLQILQAEFENYKKRVEKETVLLRKYASQEVISKLLPVLDSFELALKNTNADKEMHIGKASGISSLCSETFIKGIQMIYAQLFDVLESEGLIPITAIGKKFDPYYHEVLLQEHSEKEDEIVLEELQKGYMLNDRVLRFAKVKISKKV